MSLFALFSRIIYPLLIKKRKVISKMKIKTIVLLVAVLLLFAAACGSANGTTDQQPQEQTDAPVADFSATGANDVGNGSTVFLFEVTDGDGNLNLWNVHTDAETVGAALVDVGLIAGEYSDFGLMVMYVNGIRADFVEDGAWWAFYIDGEMAMEGVDTTDIEQGVTYAFVYTEA